MTAPSIANLIINQKSSFQVTVTVANSSGPIDLSNYSAAAKYKADYTTPDSQAHNFVTSITTPLEGKLTISLTSEQTANLHIQQKYMYDVAVTNTSTGFKSRVLEGKITVSGGVT